MISISVGTQPTQQGINSTLTTLAVQLRNLCQQISDFQQDITELGTGGLESLGFVSADAAAVISSASYLNTIAGVFQGTAAQPSTFNFQNALADLYAGS